LARSSCSLKCIPHIPEFPFYTFWWTVEVSSLFFLPTSFSFHFVPRLSLMSSSTWLNCFVLNSFTGSFPLNFNLWIFFLVSRAIYSFYIVKSLIICLTL
jgi:hypothetical protein